MDLPSLNMPLCLLGVTGRGKYRLAAVPLHLRLRGRSPESFLDLASSDYLSELNIVRFSNSYKWLKMPEKLRTRVILLRRVMMILGKGFEGKPTHWAEKTKTSKKPSCHLKIIVISISIIIFFTITTITISISVTTSCDNTVQRRSPSSMALSFSSSSSSSSWSSSSSSSVRAQCALWHLPVVILEEECGNWRKDKSSWWDLMDWMLAGIGISWDGWGWYWSGW